MKRFLEHFINNGLLVNVVTVAMLIAGIMFMFTSRKEAFPKVDFGWVIVTAVYPGATPGDVEKLVSKPLEDQMQEVSGLKEIYSLSRENLSIVVCELDPDLDDRDRQKAVQEVKDAVDKVNDLPADVEDPEVMEITTSEFPVIRFSLMNKNGIKSDAEEFEARKYAKILKDRLQGVKGAASAKIYGYREREMMVEVSLAKLSEMHVALNEVSQALSAKNVNFPGGTVSIENEDVVIRTIGEFQNAEEIEAVTIRANDVGQVVKVGDVAKVRDTFEDEKIINKINGEKSITVAVIIKDGADIIDLVKEAKKVTTEYEKMLPEDYEIVPTDDLSYYVNRRLKVLVGNAIVGLCLVVVSLFLSLGWRIALVTAFGLPVAFAGTFWMMGVSDISINLISMFGLIMVLGMLVDDAIIVAENIYRHLEDGYELREAVLSGVTEVITPIAGTILTTIAAFAPLMFVSGAMGKMMWALPAVVSVALLVSWAESMLILPSHIYDIEKRFAHKKKAGSGNVTKKSLLNVRDRYVKVLAVLLRHKIVVTAGVVCFLAFTVFFAIKVLKFDLFPEGGIETFLIKVEAPAGTSLENMDQKIRMIEHELASLPEGYIESYISRVGIVGDGEEDPNSKEGNNYGMIIVNMTPFDKRDLSAQDLMADLRESFKRFDKEFTKLELKIQQNGPPSSSDIEVNISGEDFEVMNRIANEYIAYIPQMKGKKKLKKRPDGSEPAFVENIKNSYEDKKKEIKILVDQEMAIRTGISVLDVAGTIRSCYAGSIATEIRLAEEEIDVRVILPETARTSLDKLQDIKVANRMGGLIPLMNVASVEQSEGVAVIGRMGWRRTISVSADITAEGKKSLSSVEANLMLKKQFADIEKKYPGYEISYRGGFEDTGDALEGLGKAYGIALLGIYIILVALFKNLRQPLVVMSIVPFSMCGVVYSFFVHGLPLSFMALMGIVGLGGVIVNDSIVLVDFINTARKNGKDVYLATLEAGYKRIRPIMLTSITTILGLLPTAYGWGGSDPFLVPMAVAMAYGLMFGTLITLFVTPLVYNIAYSGECRKGYQKGVCVEDIIEDEKIESMAAASLYPEGLQLATEPAASLSSSKGPGTKTVKAKAKQRKK